MAFCADHSRKLRDDKKCVAQAALVDQTKHVRREGDFRCTSATRHNPIDTARGHRDLAEQRLEGWLARKSNFHYDFLSAYQKCHTATGVAGAGRASPAPLGRSEHTETPRGAFHRRDMLRRSIIRARTITDLSCSRSSARNCSHSVAITKASAPSAAL